MKLSAFVILAVHASMALAWMPVSNTVSLHHPQSKHSCQFTSTARAMGYLDDLSDLKIITDDEDDRETTSRENTRLKQEYIDRFGVGSWESYVEFNEFDGGDGQMGVAGDGKKGLEKEWTGEAVMSKSKVMSAKNAWGRSTGYAEELKAKGIETSRAQQLENWHNQQEILAEKRQQRYMTDEFDAVSKDENWRDLAKFGVERNQDFDLDKTFGEVTPGSVLDTIELKTRINRAEIYEFNLKNNFMGFSDFRARFTPDYGDWTISPKEGSLSGKTGTDFIVKFRPSNPGISEAHLVIDTEDDKWTYKCIGTGSM